MALSVVVFDVGETLVDEATTRERWEGGLRAVRIRRGAHARVESPVGTVTIGSLTELPEALDRV